MKKCLECDEVVFGREDKKFCSDCCRNSFNNKMHKDTNNLMRNINNKLRKNYRILCELNTKQKTRITRTQLLNKGFDFEYYTNQSRSKAGKIYNYIYNQGYLPLNQHLYILVKKDTQN